MVNIIQGSALLPLPEPEAKTVGEAQLMFLVWPRRLIQIVDPLQPITVNILITHSINSNLYDIL